MADPIPKLKCGDSHTVTVQAKTKATDDAPSVPVDISGCRVSWTLRTPATMRSTTDADAAIAKVTAVPEGVPVSSVEWDLSPTETRLRPGVYRSDVQIVRDGRVVSTDVTDVEFCQDVTKDIA